ncbi:MAG: aspartate/glutamate racemase family protein [Xanthomonadales bacterium]|nr:aspartate/glutamate racemase family protein [Xanthomonadales bacterium]
MSGLKSELNNKLAWPIRVGCHFLALVIFALVSTAVNAKAKETPEWLPGLLEKESITVVITDSGLGGLAVLADAAQKFRQHPVFKQVNLVFFNALFSDQSGYNGLQTREEKLAVFSSALQSMEDLYAPDIILVACNTLSVLIPDTDFARTSSVPVVGIVADGVELIAEQLQGEPSARSIIFATQTTVDEGTHKNLLQEQGFADEQVLTQSCPQLSLHIEQGYDSEYTEMLIDAYVDEALTRAGDIEGPISVSFNCTHFGYSMDFWKLAFTSRGVEVTEFLDPNTQMIDFLLPEALQQRYPASEVSEKMVSMIDIPQDRQDSIGRWLHAVSPETETALRDFELKPDLFKWQDLNTGTVD